jgi:two-component system sensor histidine kinase YesM
MTVMLKRMAVFVSNLSIFHKIFYGIIAIVMVMLILSGYVINSFTGGIMLNEAKGNASRLLSNINNGFEDNLEQVDRIIISMYADQDVSNGPVSMYDVISTPAYLDSRDENQQIRISRNFFQRLLMLRNDFNSYYIYISPEKILSDSLFGKTRIDYHPTEEEWYRKTVAAGGKTAIFPPHLPYQLRGTDRKVISFGRLLQNLDNPKAKPYGVILLDLSESAVDSIVDRVELSPETGVLFLDEGGLPVYSRNAEDGDMIPDSALQQVMNGKEGRLNTTWKGGKALLTFSTSNVTGWKLITLTPYNELHQYGKKLLPFYSLLALFAILTTTLLSFAYSKFLYRPIQHLKSAITQAKMGNFDFQIQAYSGDELGQLTFSFNSMLSTIKTLITEKYGEKIARQEAEFKYLQAQINPHFLYNTLQIIHGMAIRRDAPEISRVSTNLAKIMRYSLSGGRNIVPLKDEMAVVSGYLGIQMLRFEEFLQYEIELDESLHVYGILKLLLQPVVENSIFHGIEARGEDGQIRIACRKEEHLLFIKIWDNGVGMSETALASLIVRMESDEDPDEGNSIGLRNIHKRIQLTYGPEYGLLVESAEGEWTSVTVRIPAVLA